tara:strand:+ start:4153 stop:4317 length:165 start_codon:yes stop_codon:yes gene_type:complete
VDVDKTIELAAEMTILACVMFLVAFFCFRVLLLPNSLPPAIDETHEVGTVLSEK